MKVYKYLTDRTLKDQESIARLRAILKDVLDEDAKVIICEQGDDLKPLKSEYFGIQFAGAEDDNWVLDEAGNIKWYPCREIAEIDANRYEFETEVVPFNGVDEVDAEKLLEEINEGLMSKEEAKKELGVE